MSKEFVTHPSLPKAKWLHVRWNSWFLPGWWNERHLEKRLRMPWFMYTRGANFAGVWIGPLCIEWARPWLRWVAETYHPELFEDKS